MCPGSAGITAPYRERQEVAYRTGKRIVEMVAEDLKPSDIMTREAFLNAIVVNSAIGGSTNAPLHLAGIARHIGAELTMEDWQDHGHQIPLLVNLQPAGEYLGEDYYRAGGESGRAHVCTPVPNAPLVVSLLLEKKNAHDYTPSTTI